MPRFFVHSRYFAFKITNEFAALLYLISTNVYFICLAVNRRNNGASFSVVFIRKTISLGALLLLGATTLALAAPTNVTMRDPSTIVKRGDTYWVFGTGKGVQSYSSTDLMNWTQREQVFAASPEWTKTAVPGNKINVMWAPDIHEWNGKYYLYYSFSTLGSNNSAIGLATSATLAPGSWQDQGPVIISQRGGDFNAIDPSVFTDFDGKRWMAYGSYWSGLKMLQLDAATGKALVGGPIIDLATRPGVPGNAIEAPAIYPHDGWYYAFVTWGGGASYNTRVGRSRNVTGPYLDRDGKKLIEGGGSLFLTSTPATDGRPGDDQVGPGHVGILKDGDRYFVSTHYEGSRFNNATTVNVNPLIWDADGWPRVVLDGGPFKMVSSLPKANVLTVRTPASVPTIPGQSPANEPQVQNTWFQNAPAQWWRPVHLGAGYYALVTADNRALTVAGDLTKPEPNAILGLAPLNNLDTQSWFLSQNEDGTYRVQPKLGNGKLSLDVAGCSNLDGAAVALWNNNDAACQKWSFRQR